MSTQYCPLVVFYFQFQHLIGPMDFDAWVKLIKTNPTFTVPGYTTPCKYLDGRNSYQIATLENSLKYATVHHEQLKTMFAGKLELKELNVSNPVLFIRKTGSDEPFIFIKYLQRCDDDDDEEFEVTEGDLIWVKSLKCAALVVKKDENQTPFIAYTTS